MIMKFCAIVHVALSGFTTVFYRIISTQIAITQFYRVTIFQQFGTVKLISLEHFYMAAAQLNFDRSSVLQHDQFIGSLS